MTQSEELKQNIIKVRLATEAEERLTDALQPLLEIAEGKSDIENWNDEVMKILDVFNQAISSAKEEEVEKMIKIGSEWRAGFNKTPNHMISERLKTWEDAIVWYQLNIQKLKDK